jgi:hypothetical protein
VGSRYTAAEIDEIRDWAHHIAGEPVSLKRAIKMRQARDEALRKLRAQERVARSGLRAA